MCIGLKVNLITDLHDLHAIFARYYARMTCGPHRYQRRDQTQVVQAKVVRSEMVHGRGTGINHLNGLTQKFVSK